MPAVNQHINGMVDQVRVFNKAVSSDEVHRLYFEMVNDILGDGSAVTTFPFDFNSREYTGSHTKVDTSMAYTNNEAVFAASGASSVRLTNGFDASNWDNPFTWSFWLTIDDTSHDGHIFTPLSTRDLSARIRDGVFQFALWDGSTSVRQSVTLTQGQKYHIVCVRKASEINIYVDSLAETPTPCTITILDISQYGWKDVFGEKENAANSGFLGKIDHFRFFNKAVNDVEVDTLYHELD